jgi:tungstate transport system ATP-binding protein
MTAQFHLKSIQKCYGTSVALNIDELTIWPARLYTLIGPNGSGKSTLLNILALLLRPERGNLVVAGSHITWKKAELSSLRKKITLLHQSPYLFAGTVFSNIAFGLKIRGITGESLRRSIADSLALVGLSGFEERHVRQLSGGEIRRVALARVLVIRPHVLLLDEPLANMDEESAALVECLVTSLPATGMTVVMSTHQPQQAERMQSHVIQLLDGTIEQTTSRLDARADTSSNEDRYAHL